MSKFLRQIEFRGFLRHPTYDETEANTYSYFKPHPNYLTGFWAFVRNALPVPCFGLQKINFYGCANATTRCDDACLNIGAMWVELPPVDAKALSNCRIQQELMVDLAYHGMQFASKHYGFDLFPFESAKTQTVNQQYRFEYQIGKSKTSPDRRTKAFIWCYFDNGFKTELVLLDRDMQEIQRLHFGCANEMTIAEIAWTDSRTVRVSTKGFNDSYWTCTIDGEINFHFGLADSNNAHHIYMNACVLIDGTRALPDPELGIKLLRRAAAMGYKHAQRRLENL
jgi:hypothetical protein